MSSGYAGGRVLRPLGAPASLPASSRKWAEGLTFWEGRRGRPGRGERGPARMPAFRAPTSALVQRGAIPLQAYALRPETEGNCVAVRRGGEQPEVRDQSAG